MASKLRKRWLQHIVNQTQLRPQMSKTWLIIRSTAGVANPQILQKSTAQIKYQTTRTWMLLYLTLSQTKMVRKESRSIKSHRSHSRIDLAPLNNSQSRWPWVLTWLAIDSTEPSSKVLWELMDRVMYRTLWIKVASVRVHASTQAVSSTRMAYCRGESQRRRGLPLEL